ncbi:MAG: excinuclease ABC subunit UvrA [Alphaproteobacteria bacterium]|nr:excinuclease ABC subunit UvrA [Alphaproteobacteria bacterium]
MNKEIRIRGARQNNLKNIDVTIPRDSFTVITGLSGSGKSSLAFDTLYAEGQRRYVESLSAYARQFLEMMQKPDVDSIEGLSPAISIEQKTTSHNPRSTVGTVTEIYDYLRLLFARVGVPYSPATGLPIESQTVSQMADRIRAKTAGTKLLILAPIVRSRKGAYQKELQLLQKQGFQRVKIDGAVYDLDALPTLDKNKKHDIAVVVDRLIVKPDLDNRLPDSLETALKLTGSLVIAENAQTGEQTTFSSVFACPVSGFTIEEIEPRLFSFNNPHGACPACDGLGEKLYMDPALVVPDESLSLAQEALAPWKTFYMGVLDALCRAHKQRMTTPWKDLPQSFRNLLLYGSGDEPVAFSYREGGRTYRHDKPFEGVIPNIERRWQQTESAWMREELSRYQRSKPCEACGGKRLKPEALAVKVAGKNISEVTALSIANARAWIKTLPQAFKPKDQEIAARILKEIGERLGFLSNVGLDYLTLSRASATLSGGESQRIRLASQIGSGLTGVLYVLDEPSIGLHQRDNGKLLETLKRLRDLGNTVLVVEHDDDAIRQADHLIDIGPGAGIHGGRVMAQGTPQEVAKVKDSITAQYLRGDKKIPVPAARRTARKGHFIEIKGASGNNLKNVTARFPLGLFTAVTGVSGSGKSTLVIDTLYRALAHTLNGAYDLPAPFQKLSGIEQIDKVVNIGQDPIGRTPRSNPATYTGLFTPIREWFAGLPEAKARGYKAGRFSFNVKGGRCEACEGDGTLRIAMHFLPDVYVTCDECHGKRYNKETLEVLYRGKSIADVLDMTVEEGADFFKAIPSIRGKLDMLNRVGLSYIKIGQAATTLSGGEAQRVKLAKELARRATGKTLYLLDEPTTGLHVDDVGKLLDVLHALTDQGNTVIVIEHNMDVIKTADHVIDLGPEGGDGGGTILSSGTPEDVAATKQSYTGQYLAAYLANANDPSGAKASDRA